MPLRLKASSIYLLIIIFIGFSACTFLESAIESTSKNAPEIEIEVFGNINYEKGILINLSQFNGQPVLINFWYPSCPPCRLEMPHLESAWKKYSPKGLQVIGIQSLVLDTIEEGQEFVDEFGITFAIGPDKNSDMITRYNAVSWPTTVFLNDKHEIVRTWVGAISEDKLDEIISPLIQQNTNSYQ